MKFNLSNLSWHEFEKFGSDLMSKILKCKFTRGTPGPDGGIDLLNSKFKYIVQCKHIVNYNNLKGKLISEIPKVKKLSADGKLEEYFLLTSCELSFTQKYEIFDLFGDHMTSIERNIISCNEIDDLLELSENKEILRSNHKLWLSSMILIELLRDNINTNYTNQLKSEINETLKIFVETQSFWNAWRVLIDEGALLLSGNPGVGKTSISRMLISKLVLEDNEYEIIYISSNDIDTIVSLLSFDTSKKQIFYMDDFLGKTYLNIDLNKLKPLESLIGMVKNNRNKKIILNSRITILSDVMPKSYSFKQKIDGSLKKIVVEVGELTSYDKALILYNHLYFNKVPLEYYKKISENKNYEKIINHKSFNPRIIEYVTSKSEINSVNSDDYLIDVLNKLDNPDFIWEDEYISYSDSDRIFCSLLLTLNENHIDTEIIQDVYNHYVIKNNLKDYDEIDIIIDRLKGSFINVIKYQNDSKAYVKFSNPSIIDYLKNKLSHSSILTIKMFESALYLEQLNFLTTLRPELILKLDAHNLLDYFVQEKGIKGHIKSISLKNKFKQAIDFVVKNTFLNYSLKDQIGNILENLKSGDLLLELAKNKDMYDYYSIDIHLRSPILEYIILNDMNHLASSVIDTLDNLNNIIQFSSHETKKYIEDKIAKHKSVISNYIQAYAIDCANDYINDNISNLLNKFDYEVVFDHGYPALNNDFWEYSESDLDHFNANLIQHIEKYIEENISYPNLNLNFVGFKYNGSVLEKSEVEEQLIEIERQQHFDYEPDYEEKGVDYHDIFLQPYDID